MAIDRPTAVLLYFCCCFHYDYVMMMMMMLTAMTMILMLRVWLVLWWWVACKLFEFFFVFLFCGFLAAPGCQLVKRSQCLFVCLSICKWLLMCHAFGFICLCVCLVVRSLHLVCNTPISHRLVWNDKIVSLLFVVVVVVLFYYRFTQCLNVCKCMSVHLLTVCLSIYFLPSVNSQYYFYPSIPSHSSVALLCY